jgi:hypothetical protein
MKQFLVLLAILPLMLGLLTQISLSQSNFALTVRAESIMRDCREAAAHSGGFSAELRMETATRLANVAGVSPADISIEADEAPDADGVMRYRAAVPVRRLMAAPAIFGVDSRDNSSIYVIEGSVHALPREEATTTEAGIT